MLVSDLVDIQSYILADEPYRTNNLDQIRFNLDQVCLPAHPKEQYPHYGYRLAATTIARWKPWEMLAKDHYATALNQEALFNIRQFNEIAPAGLGYELGVYTGGVSRMLQDDGRKMVCFDTFEGIVGSDPHSDHLKDGEYCVQSKDLVMEYLQPAEIVVGDIMDTLANRPEEDVAFVHLDMDVLKPTAFALRNIWPSLKNSGVIVLDDYGVWCTQGIKQAVDEFNPPGCKKIYLPTGQMVLIKCREK